MNEGYVSQDQPLVLLNLPYPINLFCYIPEKNELYKAVNKYHDQIYCSQRLE